MADATEGVVAAIAAAGGDNEVVFAAWDRIAKDDFGGDGVAFENFRLLDGLRLVETAAIEVLRGPGTTDRVATDRVISWFEEGQLKRHFGSD